VAPDGHWNLRHRAEAARGLDSTEDLYTPGIFDLSLSEGESVCFTATIEATSQSGATVLESLQQRDATLMDAVGSDQPHWIRQLALAASQFLVARGDTPKGRTVIAGYPWFGDWGRDTMIALPGLTLATNRADIAVNILRTFARHVDQGLLPNRFPDSGDAPEYNTVDATLWYFVSVHEYLRATADMTFAHEIYPVLENIIEWHRRGTCHAIAVDPTDGLLRSGAAGLQLTWMDAKVGDFVVTPRTGKAVEINALWCNALWIIGQLAAQLGHAAEARKFGSQARATGDVFAKRFWYEDGQHLYDVVDSVQGPARDPSLRPNQLVALSLPYAVLDDARARLVLRACERDLLTSYGLRTLDPDDPRYVGHYGGNQQQRDGAYHQGTVWPWLLGAFARAHLRLYRDVQRAASYLAPLEQHLCDACVGQISEIFDADPPHTPQGCVAQAWSVAEILRSWLEIHSAAAAPQNTQNTLASPKAS
jgi:predicted glycogen debranching enzyme